MNAHDCSRMTAFQVFAAMLLPGVCSLLFAQSPAPAENLLLSIPLDPATLQEKWEATGLDTSVTLGLVDDDILGRKVLEFQKVQAGKKYVAPFNLKSKDSISGAYVIQALVRFPGEVKADAKGRAGRGGIKMAISCGTGTDPEKPGPAYILEGGTGGNNFPFAGKRGVSKNATEKAWGGSGSLVPDISAADVSPLAKESVRLELESSLSKLPVPHNTWIPIHIEVGTDQVRMYYNGALVTDAPHTENSTGPVILEIRDTTRLAGLTIRQIEKPAGPYVSVPLEKSYNAKGPIDLQSLGPSLDPLEIHGIPFSIMDGLVNDHVDIGQSIFRYRMGTQYTADYDHRKTTPDPLKIDPTRIMFTIPSRAYAKAWILASSDEAPDKTPLLTIRFFKPHTGWATDASTMVPSFTAKTGDAGAQPVKVKTINGKDANLWLVPVELNTAELAADYRGQQMTIELTKEVKPNVAWPDPNNYSYQAGGLPSSVQLYGLTLEEAPVHAVGTSDVHGNTYTAPEKPDWKVTVRNQTARELPVLVKVAVTDPYGKPTDSAEKKITLKPGETQVPSFQPTSKVFGLHTVQTTVSAGNWSQSRNGGLLLLPAFDRKETGASSPWGVWVWGGGGHGTNPDREENARLLKAVGAINHFDLTYSEGRDKPPVSLNDFRKKWGLGTDHDRIIGRTLPDWAAKNPVVPSERDAFREEIGKRAQELKEKHPDFQYVNCFAENSISLRLTHGVRAAALGLPEYIFDAKEQTRIAQMLDAAITGAEGVKKYAPEVKFLFGHGAPNFAWPFFDQKGWNPDLFAGIGLDMPQFERMPERQPRATEPSLLYFLQKEVKDRGYKMEFVHLESYFPSSHELALGHRGQADSIVRTAVLSLALGTTKFMHTWSLHDCSDRWGNQHYGCVGLISRAPEYNPKPAAAGFATMTRMLDKAPYDGWVKTGSHSSFCVRFKGEDRLVYAAWTVRGSRPLEVVPDSEKTKLVMVDENGNEFPLTVENGKASVTLTPTPLWIVARGGSIQTAAAGTPVYTDTPGVHKIVLDDFEKGEWGYDGQPFNRYASNNWDMARQPVAMAQERARSDERQSTVWRIQAADLPRGKPCVGMYAVFTPAKPILIPGQAKAIGIYGKGNSQWFRFLYELTDAKGETWISCGQKNAWNSDDIHSWSYFNFDGWRYMEFPVPASAPGDNYRERSCYSWGCSDDGIVDLPLKLTKVIVEMRTDIVYVNEMLPVENFTVELDDLMAVYDKPENMTDAPVKLQVAAKDAWRPKITASVLPNPIARLLESGIGEPAVIEKIYPPEVMASGDQIYVKVKPVDGATKYSVYVSAYADGKGAQALGKPEKDPTITFVRGLQPSIPMYFFASYTDKDGKESKPSPARETVLKDEFPFK